MVTLQQIRLIAQRSQRTLVQDTMGAAALTVILVVTLHVPGFV